MSEWSNEQLYLYETTGNLHSTRTDILEATGSTAWHEIGGEQSVVLPWSSNADFGLFGNDKRVVVTVTNTFASISHTICDFIIEACTVEERPLDSGGGTTKAIRISGRDVIKELSETPMAVRHISKYRIGGTPTAITKTTLQMNPTDTAAYPSPSLIGWTIELQNGDWSEVTAHTAGGLLTIDPAWQVNVKDENAPAPSPQQWYMYGAALTELTGTYTDLKMTLNSRTDQPKGWWNFAAGSYQSTANGSFLACKDSNILKTFQQIAAQNDEYFFRTPGKRQIDWRRLVPVATHPQYGSMILLSIPFDHTPVSIWYAHILPGQKLRRDTAERVTRVRPTGGGSGDEVLTLKDLPTGFTPAAGFTIDGEFLISTAAETGSMRIGKELRFDSIEAASDNKASRQIAAQALYRAALYWLREHNTERYILECDVQTSIPIPAVSQLAVNLGGLTTEGNPIYIGMFVLESSPQLRADGSVIYRLKLSDKKAPIMTDERLIAKAIRDTDTRVFTYNAPARNSRAIDVGRSGGKDGGGGGGDSHPAATAGNAAIGVSPAQAITLNLAGPSGLNIAGGGLALADTVAGSGLGISNKVINVGLNPDSGMVLGADALGLGTPSTLSAVSANAVSGAGHTHAVTATADGKATPNTLLKGDSNGDLTTRYSTADKLVSPRLESAGGITLAPANNVITADANLSFTGGRTVSTTTGNLTIAPASTLIFSPAGNVIQVNATSTLRTAHAAVGTFPQTGWQVDYDGKAYFTNMMADELHVAAFTADMFRVKIGGEYITESMGEVSRNFTVPAVNATGHLYIWDAPGFPDAPLFIDGDWVLLRLNTTPGGGLLVANVWGQVTGWTDQANGEQRWTFTTRIAGVGIPGKTVPLGTAALDYGKAGSGWWYVTAMDKGGPHAGVGMWYGANPTANPVYPIRIGQLIGVSGRHEFGFQAGNSGSVFTRFSPLGNEIHGSRLSLYSGEGAQLRVSAVDVVHWRTAGASTTLVPNQDHTAVAVVSTAGNYWSTIDEGTGAPNHNDYVRNDGNRGGMLFVGLTNPTWGGSTYKVDVKVTTVGASFAADTVRLYAQVFKADEQTALTAEALVRTQTTNSTATTTVTMPQHDMAAPQVDWNNARLRLRWEYDIVASNEAIRLDPNVPSIAVGHPLPTGLGTGTGFWVGRDATYGYSLRVGNPAAAHMRYTGSDGKLAMRQAGNDVITFKSDGTSYFERDIRLGANGGIWQAATGSFAVPKSGLKIWNESGEGRLALFDDLGTQRVTLRQDRGIEIANSSTYSSTAALNFVETTGGMAYGGLFIYKLGGDSTLDLCINTPVPEGTGFMAMKLVSGAQAQMYSADVKLLLNSNYKFLHLTADSSYPSFYIGRGGLGVGYDPYSLPAIPVGVIALNLGGVSDNPQIVLQDTTDIAHGMTDIASTSTYANFAKLNNSDGGLLIRGLTETVVGLNLAGYGTTTNTATSTAATGAVHVSAFKKSGTGTTSYGSSDNIFVVRNNLDTRFIVKGNGDFHYDGTGAAYDDHDDVGLLRALAREMWAGTIDSTWDKFITVNRQNLVDAGIISDSGFINGAALNRLLTGAIWQLNERLAALEGRAS